jgi:ABC-2 type transport system ATP-binding protein
MVVKTERLTKRFPGAEAVIELTLEVPEGAVFALAGPNGAGKTTALKTVMNILTPTSGSAEVLGIDSRRLGPEHLARIGYVSENQDLPDWMSSRRFLAYCREFYATWNDAEARALLTQFEVPFDRPLRTLSRGMRMKAVLASSLAYRPQLLVLDEPFSGLDILVREQLIECVLERAAEMTVLIASHDLSEIESFATHLGYIDQGRLQFVEEMGSLSERFREVEVTFDGPVALPAGRPSAWLGAEVSASVLRFTDSRFDPVRTEAEVRRLFPGVQAVNTRSLPLRSIFVALARSAKQAPSPR